MCSEAYGKIINGKKRLFGEGQQRAEVLMPDEGKLLRGE
jgi:hypothetical protein